MRFLEPFLDDVEGAVRHVRSNDHDLRELVTWALANMPQPEPKHVSVVPMGGRSWIETASIRKAAVPIANSGKRKQLELLTKPELLKIGGYMKGMGRTISGNGESIVRIAKRVPDRGVLGDIWDTLTVQERRMLGMWTLRYLAA